MLKTQPSILLLDNYDSFTYNLYDYLCRLGANCTVFRNHVSMAEIDAVHWDGIVLSPGPGRPEQAGIMMQLIERHAGKVPILGVCLGHQAIGIYLGAELVKADKPMHGKVSAITHNNTGVFTGLPREIKVVRYHSLLLQQLPRQVVCNAQTLQGEIMGIRYPKLKLGGIQFHPEAALTEFGLLMLGNWIIELRHQ